MEYRSYFLDDVYRSEARELFTVVSTFAGGGGSSTGYRLAGGKILAINEFVEEAQKTYAANYPSTPILPGDIKDLSGQEILDTIGLKPGELDILDGSPPCSAFSISGAMCSASDTEEYLDIDGELQTRKIPPTHKSAFNKTKDYSDGKTITNIEDLFFEYIRVAKDIQPKVIVAENVKGLTIGHAKEYLNKILNAFEEMDYLVSYQVINSAKHGVPQSRHRTIFIAVRQDIANELGLNFMTINSVFPEGSNEFVSCKEALETLEMNPGENKERIEKFVASNAYERIVKNMPKNPDKILDGAKFTGLDRRTGFNTIRACGDLPSPTLVAHVTSKPIHWEYDRHFTIKEMMRIQSLPDDFILTGTESKQSERIGRMVPPKMMEAIAKSIYEKVLKPLDK